MSQSKTTGYEVKITSKQSCIADKSKYNKSFSNTEQVAAENYFNTLAERYQAFNFSKPDQLVKRAEGVNYVITLTTTLE